MRSSTARQKSEARIALHHLLVELFDEVDLGRWIRLGPDADIARMLPTRGVSMDELVHSLITALQRRNRLDSDFFDRLMDERPQRGEAIAAMSDTWSRIDWRPQDLDSSAAPTRWPSAVLLLGVSAFFFMAFTYVTALVLPTDAVLPVVIGSYLLMVAVFFLYERRVMEALASGAMSLGGLSRTTTRLERALYVTGLTSGSVLGADVGRDLVEDRREPREPVEPRSTAPGPVQREGRSTPTIAEPVTGEIQPDLGGLADEFPPGCPDGYVQLGERCVYCPSGMVAVPGGTFDGRTIDSLCVDRTEVTVSQYQKCVEKSRCLPLDGDKATLTKCNSRGEARRRHPINCVNWNQARRYCEARKMRLATRWEWVWVARGRDEGRKYPWGNRQPNCQLAVMKQGGDGCGTYSTLPVGSRRGGDSRDGVKDLAGNVREWTSTPSDDSAGHRVFVGGGYGSGEEALAVDAWGGAPEDDSDIDLGFRCVKAVRPAAQRLTP